MPAYNTTQINQHAADEIRWAKLMVNAQQGIERDYQILLPELAKVIERYLVSRIGQHHFIEDCVQDILIAIHHARHTYDSNRLFRPWLFAIVRHKSIDMLRKQKAYQSLLNKHEASAINDINPSYQSLENTITQGSLISALAPKYQQAITLTKLIGLTYAEAARELNISETALKVRVHRGITKLKRLLEDDEA